MPSTNHTQNFKFDTSSCYVVCAHGKTVDSRVSKRRNKFGCDNILSHNSPRHQLTIDKYWRNWFASTDHDFLRFNQRNHMADGIATDMVAGS
jgi:hypothetical protein